MSGEYKEKHCIRFKIVFLTNLTILKHMCGSPGLVGKDSRSKGHGVESRHRILDGKNFTYICCKNCNDICSKRPKK